MEIAESEMIAMTYEAAGVVYDTLHDEDKNLRFKAAQTILQQAQEAKYGHDLLRNFLKQVEAFHRISQA